MSGSLLAHSFESPSPTKTGSGSWASGVGPLSDPSFASAGGFLVFYLFLLVFRRDETAQAILDQ
jgi:hypothetical protein